MATPSADIGLIGLAVMGENLVLNMESRGFTVAVYNRTTSKVDEFIEWARQGEEVHRRPLAAGTGRRPQETPQGHDARQGRQAGG